MIDCSQFTGIRRATCEGMVGRLPEAEIERYVASWLNQPVPETKPPSLECVYRGEHLDWVDCPTCIPEKSVRIKVFACQLHTNCVMAAAGVGSIRGCGDCGSRLPHQP